MPSRSAGTPLKVFISYSHQDEAWKDLLVRHLKVLGSEVDVWDDRRIAAGDDWLPEIENAMDCAAVAVLLISADFLNSRFILGTEVPRLLERRQLGDLRVIPLIVRPCAWTAVKWLSKIQARPKDGRALSKVKKARVEEDLAALALEIQALLPMDSTSRERSSSVPRIDISRLPTSGPHLVGRGADLSRLDAAWEDPGIHVLTFVAFGGVGKSALVNRWLDSMAAEGWRGAKNVLGWSFYSRGTREHIASADRFLDHALRFFGDFGEADATWDRGLRLAELVRQEKTLLVLDGIESLQHPPGPMAGWLKDPNLMALLKGLAAANPGLCVVTTRESVADLSSFSTTAPQVKLDDLTPKAGARLLRRLNVKGESAELEAASREMGGNALALTLLGHYLRRAFGGDIRRRREVDLGRAAEHQGGHAFRVIQAYARWLGEGKELAILRLLGLFDRPAGAEALAVLRAEPAIPGLTEPLVGLADEEWQWSVEGLREHGLLLPSDPWQAGTLDAHPLVRAYFHEELERGQPAAWRDGNLRLYEYLKEASPKHPETLEAMEPLYVAVIHGCRAGRQQEAFDKIYKPRILRGEEYYSTSTLGAFGSELTALASFFEHPWDRPSSSLTSEAQTLIFNETGFCLRALGRLTEAVQLLQARLQTYVTQKRWDDASITAGYLSELSLTLGEVERALSFGERSIRFADESHDALLRLSKLTTLADALHQAGRFEESAEMFHKAEVIQAENLPEHPLLYSLRGYQYFDLLLSQVEPKDGSGLDRFATAVEESEEARQFHQVCQEVRERVRRTLEWTTGRLEFLTTALNDLILGRVFLGLAVTAPRPAGAENEDLIQAMKHLDRAADGLGQHRREDILPVALLTRAAFRRLTGNLDGAKADLAEALEIVERGSMRLHACDAHIEGARLCLQQEDNEAARRHLAQARKLVDETGYRRREREVSYLEKKISTVLPI